MAFQYSDKEDYASLLQEAHNALITRFQRLSNKRNALELQQILSEIKRTARSLSEKRDPVDQALYDEYLELINTATSIQNQARQGQKGKGQFSASGLFSRAHSVKTSIKEADDIFEEDLAAVMAAAGQLYSKESDNINMEMFLFGSKSAGSRALRANNDLDLGGYAVKLINEMAKRAESRAKVQKLTVATGKVDIKGFSKTLEISKEIPFKIQRLIELMKDSTFSLKNYTSYRGGQEIDLESLGLHFGNTNLYKAVTGAMSEITRDIQAQRSFFYRGANTYIGNLHGLGDEVATHFGHMRLIYELRGSGLLDENNHVLPVKYIIYNDPYSDAIYVKDTASILREILLTDMPNPKLFGGISISAGKIKSGS